MNANSTASVRVECGGDQVVAHVGLHALGGLADRLGLGNALSARVMATGEGYRLHDRGKVLVRAMLWLAGGGESSADIEHLRSQPNLFGDVASDSTLYRTFRRVDAVTLAGLWEAMAECRAKVWRRSGATTGTSTVVLDIDASLVEIHSENKEGTAANYKHGFGFDEKARPVEGVTMVELTIEPSDRTLAAIEHREHRAESLSVARLVTPGSVAVIGASRDPSAVGYHVLRNLLAGGFIGPVYPVNPSEAHVASVVAYPSVLDVPGDVDMAVVAVPAPAVADVVGQCARKGVSSLVVLSAGFGEIGEAGAAAQGDLRELARRNGMRLVGPNCIGVVNSAIGLNATFSPYAPRAGRIAMQSQSSSLGVAILERSARLGLGVSTFVSVGNHADVSTNDLLQYWEDDPGTDVVLLYLESFGNPRKFSRIARRVSRRKPIVAVKSGRSAAGSRAVSSHSAALASPDVAVDALFRQTGVIRVDTLDDLFDTALLLDSQPLPAGRRIAIVGNSGGPGILAADACDGAGLEVPQLSPATQAALRTIADPNAAIGNPVDLIASATPDIYQQALTVVLADEAVDAAIVISTPTFAAPAADVAVAIGRVAAHSPKPIVGCFLAWPDLPPLLSPGAPGQPAVPAFASPEPAARVLARAAAYSEWRQRPPGSVPELDRFDRERAQQIVDDFLAQAGHDGWLPAKLIDELLAAIGVRVLAAAMVHNAAAAAAEGVKLGFPVALKALGPELIHKSDVGGVRLGLATDREVAESYREMRTRLGERMTGALVQQMAQPGVELIIGVRLDPLFGPLTMLGLGGVATELLGDRSFRVLPLTDSDAAELVRSLRASPLLFGYRGSPPVDTAALEDVLQRVARLAAIVPQLAELDLNPVIVSPSGVEIVDARVRIGQVQPAPTVDVRRLSS